MGFRYNRQRMSFTVQHHLNSEYKAVNKKYSPPRKTVIHRANARSSTHTLSSEDREFLKSIGLKLRNNF